MVLATEEKKVRGGRPIVPVMEGEVGLLTRPTSRYETDILSPETPEKIIIQDGITYGFSKNPKLLAEYYELREKCYREDLRLKNFSGEEDHYDRIGQILIAQKEGKVIGGSRIVVSSIKEPVLLPMEEEYFRLTTYFPELSQKTYGEFSRLAVAPHYRSLETVCRLVSEMTSWCIARQCYRVFAISPKAQARYYKLLFHQLGYPYEIAAIDPPYKKIYEHLKYCISVGYLGKSRL